MLTIRDSDRFKKEYTEYKSVIDNISVETAKQHGYNLLAQLQKLVRLVEQSHSTQNSPVIDPRNTRDTFIQIIDIRKQLTQLVKDAQR